MAVTVFFECWSDLVGEAVEVDGVGGADLSGGSQGEVEIEQGSGRTGTQGGVGRFFSLHDYMPVIRGPNF